MKFAKLIIFLALFCPFMAVFSGCYSDAFLDAMKEETDFIAPFDVVLTDEDTAMRTAYFPLTSLDTSGSYTLIPAVPADGSDNIVQDNITGLMWTRCTAYRYDPDAIAGSGDETLEMDRTSNCTEVHTPTEWINAVKLCKNTLNGIDSAGTDSLPHYAGYNDWRLPRVPELISIINFDNGVTADPSIDISVFPNTVNTIDDGYWSFTSKLFIGDYFETIDNGWIVFFKQSTPGFQSGGAATNGVDFKRKLKENLSFEKQYVRCVRGGIKDPY